MIGIDIFKLIDQLSKVEFIDKGIAIDNPVRTFLSNQKFSISQ